MPVMPIKNSYLKNLNQIILYRIFHWAFLEVFWLQVWILCISSAKLWVLRNFC